MLLLFVNSLTCMIINKLCIILIPSPGFPSNMLTNAKNNNVKYIEKPIIRMEIVFFVVWYTFSPINWNMVKLILYILSADWEENVISSVFRLMWMILNCAGLELSGSLYKIASNMML